jgi:hypothetical protein
MTQKKFKALTGTSTFFRFDHAAWYFWGFEKFTLLSLHYIILERFQYVFKGRISIRIYDISTKNLKNIKYDFAHADPKVYLQDSTQI